MCYLVEGVAPSYAESALIAEHTRHSTVIADEVSFLSDVVEGNVRFDFTAQHPVFIRLLDATEVAGPVEGAEGTLSTLHVQAALAVEEGALYIRAAR